MEHPGFFDRAGPFSLGEIADSVGAEITSSGDADCMISDIRTLDDAGENHVTFFDNRAYLAKARVTKAAACLIAAKDADSLPESCVALAVGEPYRAFATALKLFYPQANQPLVYDKSDDADGEAISSSAVIEAGARIEPGAIVGAQARVGRGSVIASGAVVGYRVHIGRDCYIGPNVTIIHALVGNRVLVHSGAQIGQDGFGFAMGPGGHLKVPQIGRVVIQDDVEIGANTTIDRGALKDTVVGEGTKIDNLIQIGHNAVIGRNCVIVSMTGISGSAVLEDFVVMGAASGVVGHKRIGQGATIAGHAKVTHDVPPGAVYGGYPAQPFENWARELATIKRLAKKKSN